MDATCVRGAEMRKSSTHIVAYRTPTDTHKQTCYVRPVIDAILIRATSRTHAEMLGEAQIVRVTSSHDLLTTTN
ncbi:hypothetical protein GCM10010981_22990 [Dyella nitratireducens]|uniref:Uncharacterized protein n=1 Tax=Dyella nitratireducens TaxID=1849580 RepID=A0ABQ1FXS0_9GAMM|nr:hypothetical protein GCM10010981_22990 [Dyella nitratireducens]GLQ40732.1 hypothetical protein GCM10007902_05820 [Dyella nitratireducens]